MGQEEAEREEEEKTMMTWSHADRAFRLVVLAALFILIWQTFSCRSKSRYTHHGDDHAGNFIVFDTWTGTVFQIGGKGVIEARIPEASVKEHNAQSK